MDSFNIYVGVCKSNIVACTVNEKKEMYICLGPFYWDDNDKSTIEPDMCGVGKPLVLSPPSQPCLMSNKYKNLLLPLNHLLSLVTF